MDDLIRQLQDLFPTLSIDKATTILNNHNGSIEDSINHLLTTDCDNEGSVEQEQQQQQQFQDELKRQVEENERLLREMLDKENEQVNNQVNEKKIYTCSICYCDNMIGDFYIMDECEHRFCLDCLKNNYAYQINAAFPNVKCPHSTCKKIISYEEAKQILQDDTNLFEKYDQLLLKAHLEKDRNVRYCPYPDCGNAIIVGPTDTWMTCPVDGYSCCLKCRDAAHYEMTCEEWVDVKYYLTLATEIEKEKPLKFYTGKNWKQNFRPFWHGRKWKTKGLTTVVDHKTLKFIKERTKTCPSCYCIIEKNGGCNDVVCICGNRFCYGCGIARTDHLGSKFYPCPSRYDLFD